MKLASWKPGLIKEERIIKYMKKYYLGISLIIFCIAGFYVYSTYNKPHKNLLNQKAEFVVKPDEWILEFDTDEVKALNKYLNKIVELEAEIIDIQTIENKTLWTLKTGSEMVNIQCEMDPRFVKEALKYGKKGAQVRVQGLCSGKLMDIVLNQVVCLNK